MAMQRHLVILIGISLAVAGGRIVFKNAYARQARQVKENAFKERAIEVEQGWQRLRYTQVTETNLGAAVAARIDWKSLEMTDVQKQKLRTCLSQVLSYLEAPTFEEYYRLKTQDLHYQFTPNSNAWKYFADAAPQNGLRSMLSNFWASYHSTNAIPALTGICLESIATAVTRTSSPGALLKGKVGKLFVVIRSGMDPGIHYNCSGLTNATPICFNASFYGQAKPSRSSGPMFLSLVWSSTDTNWAPCLFESDEWLGFRAMF